MVSNKESIEIIDQYDKLINELPEINKLTDKHIENILEVIPYGKKILENNIIQKIKKKTNISIKDLKIILKNVRNNKKNNSVNVIQKKEIPLSEKECSRFLKDCKENPIGWLKKTFDLEHEGDSEIQILVGLLMIGSYMGEISHVMVHGSSGSGKTHLLNTCFNLMNPKDYLKIISTTGAALKRSEVIFKDTLVLYMQELDGISKEDAMANLILKMMSGDDSGGVILDCESVGKSYVVSKKHIEAKTIFIPYAKVFTENEQDTRVWTLECSQEYEHNKKVISDRVFGDLISNKNNKKKFNNKMKAWRQKIIPEIKKTKLEVIIPYRKILAEMILANNITPRITRDSKRYKHLIEIITRLHFALDHKSRKIFKKKKINYIIANEIDFRLAGEVAWNIIFEKITEISKTQKILIEALRNLEESHKEGGVDWEDVTGDKQEKGFTPTKICKKVKGDKKYNRKLLRKLYFDGIIIAGKTSKDGRILRYSSNPDEYKDISWIDYEKKIKKCMEDFLQKLDKVKKYGL